MQLGTRGPNGAPRPRSISVRVDSHTQLDSNSNPRGPGGSSLLCSSRQKSGSRSFHRPRTIYQALDQVGPVVGRESREFWPIFAQNGRKTGFAPAALSLWENFYSEHITR